MNKSLREMHKIQSDGMKRGENIVWHGMTDRDFDKLVENEYQMKAYTTQRYWKDGKIRKDNEPDYNSSFWYHGWSFSREKQVSTNFGEIVFAIDLNEVKKTNSVIPISWNYTIGRMDPKKINHKKEQEEFVIAHKGKYSMGWVQEQSIILEKRCDELYDLLYNFTGTEDEKEELIKEKNAINEFFEENWHKKIMGGPKGKDLNIKKISKGFFLIPYENSSPEQIMTLSKHPMCLGVLDREEILQENKPKKKTHKP